MIKDHFIIESDISNILKKGSYGMDVKKVQEWINLYCFYDKKWFYSVEIDGQYAPQKEYPKN